MSSTNRGATRKERDSYPTPQWCIDLMVDRVPDFGEGLSIIDAGAGDGRIGVTMALHQPHLRTLVLVDSDPKWKDQHFDLGAGVNYRYEVTDYLEWLSRYSVLDDGSYVFLVGNPPYSLVDPFVMQSVDWLQHHCRHWYAMFLLRLNWLGSVRRSAWLNQYLPSRITVLAPRPSFVRSKRWDEKNQQWAWSSNDSCEYAWVTWTDLCPAPMVPHFEVAVRPLKGR